METHDLFIGLIALIIFGSIIIFLNIKELKSSLFLIRLGSVGCYFFCIFAFIQVWDIFDSRDVDTVVKILVALSVPISLSLAVGLRVLSKICQKEVKREDEVKLLYKGSIVNADTLLSEEPCVVSSQVNDGETA